MPSASAAPAELPGDAGPACVKPACVEPACVEPGDLYGALAACLAADTVELKLARVASLARRFSDGDAGTSPDIVAPAICTPGRPATPRLVLPRDVAQRGLGSEAGRAALLHAVAHIEFNAIDLALDAAYRFRDTPDSYRADWISVAADEARHFSLLAARMADMGMAYGDLPAHNGLWEMAEKTAHSCTARMALVPRVLEARGLDVTPGMIARLRGVGDTASVHVLATILDEEVRHVAIGSHWFAWCCARDGLDPDATFLEFARAEARGAIRGPFNLPARAAAGFAPAEMQALIAWADTEVRR